MALVGIDLFYKDPVNFPGSLVAQMQDGSTLQLAISGSDDDDDTTDDEFVVNGVGDGVANDRLVLQAAIDAAKLVGGNVILLGGKNYNVYDTPAVVTTASTFTKVTIKSKIIPYQTFSTNAKITFTGAAGLVIQGGRACRVEGVEFQGPNVFTIAAGGLTDNANFVQVGVRDNRYSPTACIVLDPFHSSVGSSDQYPNLSAYYTAAYANASAGRNEIIGCVFRCAIAGIVNSPSGTLLGGDGWLIDTCLFDTVKTAYVCCQGQTKGVMMYNCTTTNARYVVDTVTYGQRQGFPPVIVGGSAGVVQALFNVGQGFGTFNVTGFFCEVTLRIGSLGSAYGSGGPPAVFTGCNFDMYVNDGFDSVDIHLVAFRQVLFLGCSFSMNTGSGTFRIHNDDWVTFDRCAFISSTYNGHTPIDAQNAPRLDMRDCRFRNSDSSVNYQNGYAVLGSLALGSSGTAQLARISDGVAAFTLAGAGAELQVGDHVQITAGYNAPTDDPAVALFATATSIGTVTNIATDTITLSQVPLTVEAALPATYGYTRRRLTYDRFGTAITANGGIALPNPQSISNGSGSAGLAFDSFGEWVVGNTGSPTVIAGSDVYLQEDGTVYLNIRSARVAIGQNTVAADASSLLELESTTQGFLPPRMTEAQRDAISSPAAGLLVYNTTTGLHSGRGASAWYSIGYTQQSNIVALTDNTGATANDTVENVPACTGDAGGVATVSDPANVATVASVNTSLTAVENNIADLTAKVNAILTALDGAGITA